MIKVETYPSYKFEQPAFYIPLLNTLFVSDKLSDKEIEQYRKEAING